jgi:competence protein ComEC
MKPRLKYSNIQKDSSWAKRRFLLILILLIGCFFLVGCAAGIGENDQDNVVGQVYDRGQLTVSFIDVGQGDSILIQTPLGQSMLIDGGERDQGRKVIDYLRKQGVNKIDIMVGTHPHSDHIGGLIKVLEEFTVDKVYLPRVTHTSSTFEDLLTAIKNQELKVNTAKAGISIPLEGVDSFFIAPVRDTYEGLNNYSAVVKMVYGNNSFIFTGDAEEESEKDMLASYQKDLKAEVLKIGHHGSSTSTSDGFIDAVSPQYAVITCGTDNEYSHPHKETIEKLKRAGVKIYRTDENGNIAFSSDGNSLKIETFCPAEDGAPNADLNNQNSGEDTYYIGNGKSKKFHRLECENLPAEHNQVKLKSRAEAVEAGFSPCGICQP